MLFGWKKLAQVVTRGFGAAYDGVLCRPGRQRSDLSDVQVRKRWPAAVSPDRSWASDNYSNGYWPSVRVTSQQASSAISCLEAFRDYCRGVVETLEFPISV